MHEGHTERLCTEDTWREHVYTIINSINTCHQSIQCCVNLNYHKTVKSSTASLQLLCCSASVLDNSLHAERHGTKHGHGDETQCHHHWKRVPFLKEQGRSHRA